MHENLFKNFLYWKVKVGFVCNHLYLDQDLYFICVAKKLVTLHWKAWYIYINPISRVFFCMYTYVFSINFSYIGGLIS